MRTLTSIAYHHFTACFRMFLDVIPACPRSQWDTGNESTSVWKRIFHTLESVDHWFSDISPYLFGDHFPEMSAEMDQENRQQFSKEEISVYCTLISEKVEAFFNNMDDERLQSASNTHPHLTFLDIILSQIRHIQNNTGYCSQQIRATTGSRIDWVGYQEV